VVCYWQLVGRFYSRFYLSENVVNDNGQRGKRPVPLIDAALCTGCGLCVPACPGGALGMEGLLAVVARPQACNYSGLCETVCPATAIHRPFEVVFG